MRFETRFDRWLVIVLSLIAFGTCVILPGTAIAGGRSHPPLFVAFLPLLIWAIVLPCTLPQYYVLQDDVLFIRQGWRQIFIPYVSLVRVESVTDSSSSGVFSMQRLNVTTAEGKLFVIAVREEDRFMNELAKRCPAMEHQGFGLALTLRGNRVSAG